MFHPVDTPVSFPKLEAEISRFWQQRRIYEKSLQARADAPAFVFYEGPPTANGLPHPGHCLTRAVKDLFPRYRTMRGYRCERKGGWDTHGLPVEVEVCKELGIHSKHEIEAYGVEPFIQKCLESVFRYTAEWEQLTERLGFWIHLEDAYVTYHQTYVESVWWALKRLFDRGLLYQGHKIVWWWAQGGTALSSGEVGEGYREVADPSVYVRFPLVDQRDTDLLVWTTTPWTLPSNQFAAVKPELAYSLVELEDDPRKLILASMLVETIAQKVGKSYKVLSTFPGEDLIGRRYLPPYDFFYDQLKYVSQSGLPPMEELSPSWGEEKAPLRSGGEEYVAWRVIPGDFVTTDTGTGIVHIAPAFGEVDFEVLLDEKSRFSEGRGPQLICHIDDAGRFLPAYGQLEHVNIAGAWVKDADRPIIQDLRARGRLLHSEQYIHDYPFCWRAEDDPLIQYPRRSWFIRTTQFKDKMLANNRRINWQPSHIRDGRFGNFLETNVDWALSRERYWGTPLPIWVCEETGYMEAVAGYDELLAKPGVQGTEVWQKAKRANPGLPDDLKVHKPYIDAVTYDSPKAPGKRMRRVPEVIDSWFDSGAMPFAQWGYPAQKGSQRRFQAQFPADFISEALDQTRGWFYSLLAISTLLFSREDDKPTTAKTAAPQNTDAPAVQYPHPYRNCVVLGLLLGEDDRKMSKSKRNYREPNEIFDRYGADALRWYFFANQPPWTTIRFSERAIKESIPDFLLRLWNVYSFFVIYANIDRFDPAASLSGTAAQLTPDILARAEDYRPPARRSELDRWILSELSRTTAAVCRQMDAYDPFAACGALTEFVDALSNWYVRRSRDRFWSGGQSVDKTDAYWTLYECLLTTCKLVAPFIPFTAEAIWQNLAVAPFGDRVRESVHLCDYPQTDAAAIDEVLSERMALVRQIASLGRSARMLARLKVRQPLAQVEVVLADPTHQPWLEEHAALIRQELNVKQVDFTRRADQYITYTVLPDLKRLGPRLGRRLPAVRKRLAETDAAGLLARLDADGQVTLHLPDGPVTLDSQDVQVRMQAKEGWTAAQGRSCVVVLATDLSEELVAEGLARDLVHAVQNRRKQIDCQYTDRILVGVTTESDEVHAAIAAFREYIKRETLATDLIDGALPGVEPIELKLAGHSLVLYVRLASPPS